MLSTEKQELVGFIDGYAPYFEDIADKVWENPELSLKEFKSAALYCEELEKLGFTVTKGLCGIETAFCGSYGHGAPVIGILGEFDALSGLSQAAGKTEPDALVPGGAGHGCGHNLLGAGSLAAAAAVKRYLEKSGRPGTVIFFGCPGEEGGSGKAYMAREGLWKTLDAALSWHPGDVNQVETGTNNSCIQVLYKFSGKAAHAAGDPYDGRSALDAVELMNVGVQFLREHMTEDCRIHYAITDAGGVSPNVVQAKAAVLYMVRANKVADSVALQARVDGARVHRRHGRAAAELCARGAVVAEHGRDRRADMQRRGVCFRGGTEKEFSARAVPARNGRARRRRDRGAGTGADGKRAKACQRLFDAALSRHALHAGQHGCGGRELAHAHGADQHGRLAFGHPRTLLAGRRLRQEPHGAQGHAVRGQVARRRGDRSLRGRGSA